MYTSFEGHRHCAHTIFWFSVTQYKNQRTPETLLDFVLFNEFFPLTYILKILGKLLKVVRIITKPIPLKRRA